MRLIKNLTAQIFMALLLGAVVGVLLPQLAHELKIMSDMFLRLIKMVIGPLVLATLSVGVAKLGNIGQVGRIGGKTLLYFYGATLVSLTMGLLLANFFEPGTHVAMTGTLNQAPRHTVAEPQPFSQFLLRMIPTSVVDALAKNEILPIVVFGIFLGLSMASVGDRATTLLHTLEGLSEVMLTMTRFVMVFAPLGVFGAIATVVADKGIGIFADYVYIIGVFYVGLLLFVLLGLGGICYVTGLSFMQILSQSREALLLSFSTASSESAFPKALEALSRLGCPSKISGFVLPLGYSFNLDASMMYMTFATLFLAQAYGISLDLAQQLHMVLLLLLASKGIAGVPRASLVIVSGLLHTFDIPGEGLLLLLAIDHLLDMGRSAVNMLGNVVATCVISKWENFS